MGTLFFYIFIFTAILSIALFIFFYKMDEKYINQLETFSSEHNFNSSIKGKYQTGDIFRFVSIQNDRHELMYKRQSEMPSKYYSQSQRRYIPASESYQSHWIILILKNVDQPARDLILKDLEHEIDQIEWTKLEKKLDGDAILGTNDNGDITIGISIPYYSNATWLKIKTLLTNSVLIADKHLSEFI